MATPATGKRPIQARVRPGAADRWLTMTGALKELGWSRTGPLLMEAGIGLLWELYQRQGATGLLRRLRAEENPVPERIVNP